jgi:SSS family solute:Na+ symporter
MSPSAVSLTMIFVIVGVSAAIGILAGARRKMDLEQWTVGGRGFGAVLMYLLMAGETYTTFAFLGASGWAYSRGGPTLYIMAYLTLAYVVSFFILPPIWETGRKYGMQTQSDFFSVRYGNKYLAGFVCIVGIASFIPYLQLQLTGLGLIVSIASFDGIGRTPAMVLSVMLLGAFVLASGVRAVAWVSVLKDVLMVFAVVTIGIVIPDIYFGGIGPMFTALVHAHPAHLTMPGASVNLGHTW